ncbi:MAG: hypothetical protein HYT79_09575 [Elusimicrobia bacterium]|nr:hypothetical protein [Elusimicrobiota bacterium]
MHKIAALVMPAFRFGVHDPKEAESLAKEGVSGFCLYGGTARETYELTRRLLMAAQSPLLFAADFENGAGSQLQDAVELTSSMGIGQSRDTANARLKGEITGRQAKAVGINWAFAPVVDLNLRPDNPIVSTRAFGSGHQEVTAHARSFLEGLNSQGIAGCLKHFPGHGDTRVDSHLDLAAIERPLAAMNDHDLKPYEALSATAESVMTAHIAGPDVDAKPASLSRRWVTDILRKRLGFDGLVVTDALMMGAIQKNFGEEEAILLALEAGNDLLLYPPDSRAAIRIIKNLYGQGRLPQAAVERALGRIKALAARLPQPTAAFSRETFHRLEEEHAKSALLLARASIQWRRPGPALPAAPANLRYMEFGNNKVKLQNLRGWNLGSIRRSFPNLGTAARNLIRFMHDKSRADSFRKLLEARRYHPIKPSSKNQDWPLVLGIFHKPRAFAGAIGLDAQEIKTINDLARQSAPQTPLLAVSFGDPYVLDQLPEAYASLCSYSDSFASQVAVLDELLKGATKTKTSTTS